MKTDKDIKGHSIDHQIAVNQQRLTIKALTTMLDLNANHYYPNDYYRDILKKLRGDIANLNLYLDD